MEFTKLIWIVPGSLGNHISLCSMRAVTSAMPSDNGVPRWTDVIAKGKIVSDPILLPSL